MENVEHIALWKAVCSAAEQLSARCKIYSSPVPSAESLVSVSSPIPSVPSWKLVEALSLISVLLRAECVHTEEIVNVFGVTVPIQFTEDGKHLYLFGQPTISGDESELSSRPDLVIAKTPEKVSAKNIVRIIECKLRKKLGAHEIRGEFGKAHDLRVASYLIWSYRTPSPNIVAGAKRLGLDIETLGFDTDKREILLANPKYLVAHVSNTISFSMRADRFAKQLFSSSSETALKLGL